MPRVVIITSFLKRFRLPFYEGLSRALAEHGIDMDLVYGQPDRYHQADSDIVTDYTPGHRTRNRYWYIGRSSLVWQPAMRHVRGADAVVVQQGNRHLLNHLLMLRGQSMGIRLVFWGHGRNFQSPRPQGWRERLKGICARRADYWLAYTHRTRQTLQSIGYDDDRITVVQNAVDTTQMIRDYQDISQGELQATRSELGLGVDDRPAIYCGRFYGIKQLDFTLACAQQLREQYGRFHLILVGDGINRTSVEAACKGKPWMHYVGPRYGRDKARYFKLARFQLMPGAVGLNLVDSFAFLTPMVTTSEALHGPEIDYLEHERNGLMVSRANGEYVRVAGRLLHDDILHATLVDGCERARRVYTIESMIQNFSHGLVRVLSMPRRGIDRLPAVE